MLLYTGGEKLNANTVKKFDYQNGTLLRHVDVPQYLQQPDVCLKHLCREAIRKKLIDLDPHTHLFDRIRQIGLPSIVAAYLLYNMCLDTEYDCDCSDDNVDDA